MPEARLIIYRSPDGDTDWEPVKPEDVPDWLKNPDVVGRLIAGDMAQGPMEIAVISPLLRLPWYRAERVPESTTH